MKKTIVIVGATSSIAEHCARLWAAQDQYDFILLGRNKEKLKIIKNDLQVRQPTSAINVCIASFFNADEIDSLVKEICKKNISIVLIAQGALIEQEICEEDLNFVTQSININALSPVLYTEAFYKYLYQEQDSTIAIFSSVAGDRGRKSNYVYGSAKGLVTRYVEGMQHRNAINNGRVVFTLIKPGPTDSAMTIHLKEQGIKLASTEQVAQNIIDGIKHKKRVIYTPRKWGFIMLIVRLVPFFIFKKMDI